MRKDKDYLVIPSCQGLLDCFNTKKNRYSRESLCHLVTDNAINTVFIISLFSYIYHYCDRRETETYLITLSKLKAFRGQTHGSKAFDIKKELENLNDIGCYWQDIDIDRLATVNVDGRKARVQSKYFSEIYKGMHFLTKKENGKHSSSYTSLIRTDILKERNHGAIEITIEICKLVERRGVLAEGQTAHLAINTLIARCPTLSFKIDNAKTVSRKNEILKDDLRKAMELLRNMTRIYEVFEDLEIDIPERLAVNKEGKLEITHRGRILDYEQNNEDL